MASVIPLMLGGVDHPMEDTIEAILYNFEHEGRAISIEERQFVDEIVRPLFRISSVANQQSFVPRARRLIDLYRSGEWHNAPQQIDFYGGIWRFNLLRGFVSSRAGVLRHQGKRKWTNEEIARAKARAEFLAGFILNLEDIDKLDQFDWSLPAARRGAHG